MRRAGLLGSGAGADPLPRRQGALHLLLLTLLVSPLAKRWRQASSSSRAAPRALVRRLGVPALWWWLGLDLQFDWGLIGGELVKRSYIVVGMVALLLLLALEHHLDPGAAAGHGAGLAEAAQLDCGGPAGAGALLVVGQGRWLEPSSI